MTTIHSSALASRRTIRFAPMPDPRRSVLVTDDGTELPLLSPVILNGSNIDLLTSKLEMPPVNASELASIPAAISLSALNSPAQTPSHTPQNWNVPLPEVLPPPAQFQKSLSSESDSSNSSNTSTSGSSPPTSEISSSASSMYSLTPTQSIEPYPNSTGSSTPTQSVRKYSSLRSKLSSKYNISTDQILTLGTINLFRRGSKGKDRERDSDNDFIQSSQGWGDALTRWTSAGSGGPRSGRDGVGVPMYRTQSTQSYKGENVRNAKRSSSPVSLNSRTKPRPGSASSKLNPAHENGMLSTLHSGQSKKGTRMLNGRVYGAKRGSVSGSQSNPFANAKDDPDPEFVEWGYGGMGSVRNVQDGVAGTVWGRVLSNGTSVMESGCPEKQNNNARAVQHGSRDDDDDGSGMGWVRKRREAKEREAREKAEKDAKEQAEKERQEREAQDKATEIDLNESDASDSRSFSSITTTGTTGTTTETITAGTSRKVPAPLPLPELGEADALSTDTSAVGAPVGSPTPTFISTMVTPTAGVRTPKPRVIESVLSTPISPERNVTSPDLRAVSMSRQTSNTPTISNLNGTSSPGKDEQHHVLTAVNVPAPPPMSRHHSSHHSRGKSLQDAIPKVESNEAKVEPEANEPCISEAAIGERLAEDKSTNDQQGVEGEENSKKWKSRHTSVSSTSSSSTSSSSASSISSQSESGSDSESEKNLQDSDDEDEEEDDEDESEEEGARKTSLGAGVEKVSRHK
ncbi:hypothetical protein EV368DRAFT_60923 [Lentinula lateritia]|nr:hypothetical protein EV368DRAFT_60923 [Lentinula lateritia]